MLAKIGERHADEAIDRGAKEVRPAHSTLGIEVCHCREGNIGGNHNIKVLRAPERVRFLRVPASVGCDDHIRVEQLKSWHCLLRSLPQKLCCQVQLNLTGRCMVTPGQVRLDVRRKMGGGPKQQGKRAHASAVHTNRLGLLTALPTSAVARKKFDGRSARVVMLLSMRVSSPIPASTRFLPAASEHNRQLPPTRPKIQQRSIGAQTNLERN